MSSGKMLHKRNFMHYYQIR